MFRLQSFHMYGVIGSAVVVGALSVWLIKKLNIKTLNGEPIIIQTKTFDKGQIIGGLIFGFGWAITGACPGPLFAQIGTGATVIIITLLSAMQEHGFMVISVTNYPLIIFPKNEYH